MLDGRTFFVSLAGCAPYFPTPAIRLGDKPWIERTPISRSRRTRRAYPSPTIDPMGMRSTVSRDMLLQNVFGPDDGDGAMYNAFPQLSP